MIEPSDNPDRTASPGEAESDRNLEHFYRRRAQEEDSADAEELI
jgi:hypothetical protein